MGYAALYSEALAIGAKAGLSANVFDSVIRGGRMDCPFYRTFFKYVLERDRDAHRLAIANALKDVTCLAGFAQALGVANPIGAAVRNSCALAVGAGHRQDYVPMPSDFVAQWNGLPPAPSRAPPASPRRRRRTEPASAPRAVPPRRARRERIGGISCYGVVGSGGRIRTGDLRIMISYFWCFAVEHSES